jgi:hypothetical protein
LAQKEELRGFGRALRSVKGNASLKDPAHLFNSSLDGNMRRAIDLHEGEIIDASAFKALIKAAMAPNGLKAKVA